MFTTHNAPPYHVLTRRRMPAFNHTWPYDYVIAGDGILMRIPSMGMLMDLPVVVCSIRGLTPWVSWGEEQQERDEGVEEEGVLQPCGPRYHVLSGKVPPPLDRSRVYEYLIAGNGVFLRTERRGIEVLMPISPPCELLGLTPVTPYVRLPHPPAGRAIVEQMLALARAQTDDGEHFREILFYLLWQDEQWVLHVPEQDQRWGRVAPIDACLSSSLDVFVEVHSHHTMPAYFSSTDNEDEQWFGLYGVLGSITTRPEMRLRLVVDGYRWEIPAALFFELPEGMRDCDAAWGQATWWKGVDAL